MAGKGVKYTFSVDAANYSAGANKVIAINKAIEKSAVDAGHSTVSQMQASSAAIRALENPLGNNIRAVERFITTIPGVGKALQKSFAVVGAAELTALFVKTSLEVVKFVQHLHQVPAAVSMGAEAIRASMTETSDSMEVAIDKLENVNAKLEKRPGDGLKLAIDEAAVAMDTLSSKTVQEIKQVNELFKNQSTSGFWAQLTGHQASTAGVEKESNQYQQRLVDIHNTGISSRFGANGDPSLIAKAEQDERDAARKAAVDIINSTTAQLKANQAKMSQNALTIGSFNAQDADLNALRQVAQGQVLSMNQSDRLQGAQLQNGVDIQKQEADARAKIATAKASAEQRKAIEAGLTASKLTGELKPSEVAAYWNQLLVANNEGQSKLLGDNKEFVSQKLVAATDEFLNTWREQNKRIAAELKRSSDELIDHQLDLPRVGEELAKAIAKAQEEAGDEQTKKFTIGANLTEIQQANAIAVKEASLSIAEGTGAMDAHSAAVERAQLRTEKYNAELERLQALGENLASRPDWATDKVQDLIGENKNEQLALTGQYAAQHNLDEAAVATSSFSGEWKTTLNQMANDFGDFGKDMTETFRSTITSVNSELVTLLTTRHQGGQSTRRAFMGIAHEGLSSVTGMGIKGIEGLALNGLGFGGKQGTRSNPMITQDVNAVLGAGKSAVSSVGSALASAGGGIGGIFKTALGLVPHFASGGPVSSGMTALVGENGPEIVKFGSAGTVIPNDKIGYGDVHNHTHNHAYDLTNAHDPRENERRFQKSLMAYHNSAAKTGMAGTRERMLRRPRTAGV